MEAHRRRALVKDGIDRVVEEQAGHGQPLLLSTAQRVIPVLHLVPSLPPASHDSTEDRDISVTALPLHQPMRASTAPSK